MPRGSFRVLPSILCLLLSLPAFGQRTAGAPRPPDPNGLPSFLLITADDLGVEKVGAYGESPPGVRVPCTPNLDALAAEGVLFRNAWTNPMCSPSRAQLLTGRHAFRTGVGDVIPSDGSLSGLSVHLETLLPEVLPLHETAVFGKWHLADPTQGLQHPLDSGFDHFAGSMFNLLRPALPVGGPTPACSTYGPLGYWNWVKTWDPDLDGLVTQECWSEYATLDTTDDAIAFARSTSGPFLLYVPYNAPHTPLDAPPTTLCPAPGSCSQTYCLPPPGTPSATDVTNAMIEALDTEIGRLVREVRRVQPRLVVIFMSDNGTSDNGAEGSAGACFAPARVKGTLYEGGINVPLIVSAPGVVRGECDALVSSTDVYATITELARVGYAPEDSVSLVPYLRGDLTPLRETVYAERFHPNQTSPDAPTTRRLEPDWHVRTVRNERYKLIRYTDALGNEDEFLFDLVLDPCETVNLCKPIGPCEQLSLTPEELSAYFELRAELISLGVY